MRIRNNRSSAVSSRLGDGVDLVSSRMAMLGLDIDEIESHDRETIWAIRRRCAACDEWEACAVDLERDPNNPVWEAYCPNTGTFNSLTEVWW